MREAMMLQIDRTESPVTRPRAIIFDMDNTLFDFVAAKHHACRSIVDYLGSGDPIELYHHFVGSAHGYESHENIREYLEKQAIDQNLHFAECCRIYEEEKLRVLRLFPHTREVLEGLCRRRIRTALVTDATYENAVQRLDRLNVRSYFGHLITLEMTGCKKPALQPFRLALDKLGTRPAETLLVGDSLRRDIAPARKLGMYTVHARYGDRNPPVDLPCQPNRVILDIRDLLYLF